MITDQELKKFLESKNIPHGVDKEIDDIYLKISGQYDVQYDIVSELLNLRDQLCWRDAQPESKELPEEGQRVEVIRGKKFFNNREDLVSVEFYHPEWIMWAFGYFRCWRPFVMPEKTVLNEYSSYKI